jgi:DNA repair photolyase
MIVREITCRGIVNRTGGFLSGFTHTINPYQGCSYGRTLCGLPDYAPEILRAFGETRAWGEYLDVKVNAPERYNADHDRIRRSTEPAMRVYMSSVTDPYVPQERSHRITRRILTAMRERPPDLLALQTHTPNPLWDEDLLVDLAGRFPVSVQISVETDRERLGPGFPRHAYPVAERIAALRRLRERGLETVAVVSPLWPLESPEGFARRLEEAASFVILDHYLLGDGSKDGRRTKLRMVAPGTSFPALLENAGYGEWTRLDALERVREIFLAELGPERLGVSKEGFHRAAARLAPPGDGEVAAPRRSAGKNGTGTGSR